MVVFVLLLLLSYPGYTFFDKVGGYCVASTREQLITGLRHFGSREEFERECPDGLVLFLGKERRARITSKGVKFPFHAYCYDSEGFAGAHHFIGEETFTFESCILVIER